jgi:hypothetical protein
VVIVGWKKGALSANQVVGKSPSELDGSLHEKLPYDICDNLNVKDETRTYR